MAFSTSLSENSKFNQGTNTGGPSAKRSAIVNVHANLYIQLFSRDSSYRLRNITRILQSDWRVHIPLRRHFVGLRNRSNVTRLSSFRARGVGSGDEIGQGQGGGAGAGGGRTNFPGYVTVS